ncbi:MAG: MBOAT family protein [Clostridia bacterium]|nr:MBOAT family protein [Clostridia bacterium]
MLFNSLEFLIFFPVVTLLYFAIPHRVRYIWLLFASYFFYMCWNPKYALLMGFSTISTYTAGLLIGKSKSTTGKKWCVALSFTINIAILFFFKYFDFAIDNINAVLSHTGFEVINPAFDVILPVGISFYTFQALGYTVDVYRKDIEPEKNLLRYALFVSFFPQLVAGPIERSGNLIKQLHERHSFDTKRIANGMMLMLWGFFEKLVIADRAAYVVDTVYNNYANYNGFSIVIATILFAFQIYCDFASYSDIARGAAEVMGFNLMKNFNTPYFAQSVGEFWRRWHISLSTWFRDYLYIPLGGNRKGRARKYFNLMVVFLLSGLWHGASWNFVIWGGLNGIYQVIGDMTKNARCKVSDMLGLNKGNFSSKLLKGLVTFALIDFSWVFFRAKTFGDAIGVIKRMLCEFNLWIFTDGTIFTLGLDSADMFVLLISLLVLLVVSMLKYNGVNIRQKLSEQGLWFRYVIYLAGIFAVLIFGVYGPLYDASQFIYFQF